MNIPYFTGAGIPLGRVINTGRSSSQTTFQSLTDLEELLRNVDPVRGLTTIAPGSPCEIEQKLKRFYRYFTGQARGKDAEKPTGPTPIVHQRPFAPWTGKETPY